MPSQNSRAFSSMMKDFSCSFNQKIHVSSSSWAKNKLNRLHFLMVFRKLITSSVFGQKNHEHHPLVIVLGLQKKYPEVPVAVLSSKVQLLVSPGRPPRHTEGHHADDQGEPGGEKNQLAPTVFCLGFGPNEISMLKKPACVQLKPAGWQKMLKNIFYTPHVLVEKSCEHSGSDS